jgi:hypothetical protein
VVSETERNGADTSSVQPPPTATFSGSSANSSPAGAVGRAFASESANVVLPSRGTPTAPRTGTPAVPGHPAPYPMALAGTAVASSQVSA